MPFFIFSVTLWNWCLLYLKETHLWYPNVKAQGLRFSKWCHMHLYIVYSKLNDQVMRKVISFCTKLRYVPSVPNWNPCFMVPNGSIVYKDFKKVSYMSLSYWEVGRRQNQRLLLVTSYIVFWRLYINGYSKLSEHVPIFKFPKLFLNLILYIWKHHLSPKNWPLSTFYFLK